MCMRQGRPGSNVRVIPLSVYVWSISPDCFKHCGKMSNIGRVSETSQMLGHACLARKGLDVSSRYSCVWG